MSRRRKLDLFAELVADKKRSLPKLRSTVVDSIDLEYIQAVSAINRRKVFCEQANNRAWLFFLCKRRPSFLGPLGYWAMLHGGREKAANIFHKEELWLNVGHETQKVP